MLMRLRKEFFIENISSKITASSDLHDIYCTDTNPVTIHLAKKKINTDEEYNERINNIESFFNEITRMYDPSMTLFKVLSSCTYSVFTFYSLRKKEKHEFEALGWIAYFCNPTLGLLVLFVHVKKEFRKQGVGTSMLQTLQLFSMQNIGTLQTLLWYTKVALTHSNLLVSYLSKHHT